MVRIHILARRLPHGLASRLVEEADPDQQVIGVAAQAVLRAHAIEGQVSEEAVEMRVVGSAIAKDRWRPYRSAPSGSAAALRGRPHTSLQ